MAKEDIKKFQFKKGKSGNPNGRPKKFFSSVLSEIKKNGEVVTSNMVKEVYQSLLSLDEYQITEIVKNKDLPMLYRIVGKRMLAKDGFEVIEKMLDRANGKPKQHQELSGTLDSKVKIKLPAPSADAMKAWEAAKNMNLDAD